MTDTNYETIKSLIELLVKKAGFDVDKNYSEEELEKTRSYIFQFESELKDDSNKSVKSDIEKVLENLHKRETQWENNAEILGKNILSSYKENKKYKDVETDLNKLVSLASKDSNSIKNNSLMSYVYDSIRNLKDKKTEIEDLINNGQYDDNHSKELDETTLNFLNNKIIEYETELKFINSELDKLREIETRDISTISNVKVYLSNTKSNLDRLEEVKSETIEKEIASDVWARLENASIEIKKKYMNAESTLHKFEELLKNLRKSKDDYSKRKEELERLINNCSETMEEFSLKVKNERYPDYTTKALDENENAVIESSLEELNNKKEVIYVDVNAVKNEIIKEWNKIDPEAKVIKIESSDNNNIEEEKEIRQKEEKKLEEKHDKIEFDW